VILQWGCENLAENKDTKTINEAEEVQDEALEKEEECRLVKLPKMCSLLHQQVFKQYLDANSYQNYAAYNSHFTLKELPEFVAEAEAC